MSDWIRRALWRGGVLRLTGGGKRFFGETSASTHVANDGNLAPSLPSIFTRSWTMNRVSARFDLRNQGFVRAAGGWRLAPAFDLNPTPIDVKPRVHALAIDEADASASLANALAVAPSFGIAKLTDARAIARRVGTAVARWREVAAKNGIKPNQIDRMESAFEHDDLRAAVGRTALR
jgi:hypothetical protein